MELDTIAAISTPIGEAGIAIIRISGDLAIEIIDSLFKGKVKLSNVNSHTVHYGFIKDKNDNILDEVLVTVMRAPKTFTKEDVVEVNCHGGITVVSKVFTTIIENGARIAEPGEFSKRAFLNGRIDLSQAEAIIDLIRSKTDRSTKVALKQIEGELSKKIKNIRENILEILAFIEVNIDYPEHDIDEVSYEYLLETISSIKNEISFLLEHSNEGKILREGLSIAIIGRPNVGKSSLLNVMTKENRAIVTDVPGTTRDIIEEYINIKGIPLKLIDTAGIRRTEDIVERLGVEKSKKVLLEADLVLLVFNNNESLIDEDLELLDLLIDNKVIVVINKIDLPKKIEDNLIKNKLKNVNFIYTSLIFGKGITDLENAIEELFFTGGISSDDLTYVSNSRHIILLKRAESNLCDAIKAIEELIPIDIVSIDINNTYETLGEIIGESIDEDLANQIFSKFCVGK
ncbi:MAG: tRNA uridine-5-carboxymethylaminomethyl(34) synthesis GTPase MnmE [Vulcanibacillus sp.]